MLLVSLSISHYLWQCCQSFFGLAVKRITAKNSCLGSGKTGSWFSWDLWWEGAQPRQWCWLRPLFSGRGQLLCFQVCKVVFTMSVSLLNVWASVLKGSLCPPSSFSLFLVCFSSFGCMKGFLSLLVLGVKSLNKSVHILTPSQLRSLFDLCDVERKVESFSSGKFNWYCQFLSLLELWA